jgi:hypothetical protein
MNLPIPDFLVIGAQKSGTTTLFALLRKHPKIYLPPQKEVQFFSNDTLYGKGLDWYWGANFCGKPDDCVAGEISPQYMGANVVPARIRAAMPNARLIAILRHPLARAFSHFQMSVRRGQDDRDFRDALESSISAKRVGQQLAESRSYYQYSAYSDVLAEYLKLFRREQMLVLFQEDLERNPGEVLKAIHDFLGVEHVLPDNLRIRLHEAGTVKYQWVNRLIKQPGPIRSLLKRLLPQRVRSAVKFWVEQMNISKAAPKAVPPDVERDYGWIVTEQMQFLKSRFDVAPPWA